VHQPSVFFAAISATALLWPLVVGAATVRGQVVAAASGLPLPRAVIVLRGQDSTRGDRTETTDAQGRYEFTSLPAGRYDLSASKIGFVTQAYSQARSLQTAPMLELRTENEIRDRVDFRLIRAGAITGRITDDFGEPLEARISAQRFEFSAGLRRLVAVGRPAASNDLGEFRVYGLPPGQYYLSASTSYAPTYFPGTVNTAEAQPITIAEGQDAGNISMAILPVRTARLSGTATDPDGRAMSGATVIALQAGMGGGRSQVNSDGSFTLSDLSPGEYTIKISRRLGDGQEVASAPVSINGEDVTGLTLIAQKPAVVHGRVVLDFGGTAPRPSLSVDALRVYALRVAPEETVAIGPSAGAVDSEGAFAVIAPPGPTLLRFAMLPTGWQLKAVRLNGLDVTDGGLDLPSDQTLEGVEVVISNRPSEISGTVTDGQNRAILRSSVVIFTEDRRQWNFQSRFLTRSRTDEAGRFKAASLPPGNYLAIAVSNDDLGPGEELDPAFLERALARATRFSLLEGETRAVDLKLQTLR
jgi:protocatechuate 3,4-dioxygenase beta subunit